MSEHAWAQENLGASLAAGLTPAEQERFANHVAACAACTEALEAARNLERMMQGLFAKDQPDAGLEDRMLKKLRTAPRPRSVQSKVLFRICAGVAAVVLLGLVGVATHAIARDGTLPFPGLKDGYSLGKFRMASKIQDERKEPFTTVRVDPGLIILDDTDSNYSIDGLKGKSVPAGLNPADTLTPDVSLGDGEGREAALPLDLPQPSRVKTPEIRSLGELGGRRSEKNETEELSLERSMFASELLFDKRPQGGESTYKYGLSTTNFGDAAKTVPAQKPSSLAVDIARPAQTPPPLPQLGFPGNPSEKKPSAAKPEKGSIIHAPVAIVDQTEPKQPDSMNRKIIRTGDMEFIVDSFDAAFDAISRLIDNVKGSYVKEKNRDKIANGKVRGWVIVRMPPQHLNKFVEDLRRDLGKSAELITQKIGTQDVTKQYTDLEGRLRVARAMEQRWLDIIQKGKGEIKDLIAAELALGTTRAKIEEMEGEIRYYNGQVSLSTLTINLTEKEIQAPSALVVNESVRMRLEVDDVEKSFKEALAAVLAAKGRVTKSEIKQQAIGKLEGIVLAEVPPAQDGALRESLKKLGILRHQDAERTQQTEGGSGPPLKLEAHYKDVQFEIKLYNTANVQPRETFTLQIATLDVVGSYRKLHDAVTQAKGQVLAGTLSEQDKLNTSAKLDFDLLANQKQAIDKLIAEVGRTLTQSNNQVPATEVATDRQVGYRLSLRSVASIAPRETIKLTVEVKDMKLKASDLTELVIVSKGLVVASKTQNEQNGTSSAALIFDVPFSVEGAVVRQIKDSGYVRQEQTTRNPQVPENDLATARIELTLVGTPSIVPAGEGLGAQVRTSLEYSFKMFSFMLMFVILGVSVVLPWVLVLWVVYRLVRRFWSKPQVDSVA